MAEASAVEGRESAGGEGLGNATRAVKSQQMGWAIDAPAF